MFFNIRFATLSVLSLTASTLGREFILERDGKAVFLAKRRFGKENPEVIDEISRACGGGACATIAGSAISTLLAANPECGQQDKADEMIDLANTLTNANEKAALIAAAIKFRQAEKNTLPDFTTNPPTPRNSVFCQKAPKNPQLNGLVQAQDPANGDVFFDPATKASVQRGAAANTAPFGGQAAAPPAQAPPAEAPAEAPPAEAPPAETPPAEAPPAEAPPAEAPPAQAPPANNGNGNGKKNGKKNRKGKKKGKGKGAKAGAAAPPAQEPAAPPAQEPAAPPPQEPAAPPAEEPTAPADGDNENAGNNGNAGGDLQKFAKALGGVEAPTVTANGNQFAVAGNASFNNLQSALVRSCDVQNNKCADASNGAGNNKAFSVSDCNAQQTECIALARQS